MGGNAFADPRHDAEDSSSLLSAASAIADDCELDWARLETSTEGSRQRGELRELRVIQVIARRHRALQSALEPTPMPMPPGRRLGDFEIVSELGRGGMAIVYEAVQIPLGRRVALKVLPAGVAFSTDAVRRFKTEAHAAAMLRHANIVSIHATGEEQGCPFYAMELVEGPSLQAVLDAARTGRSLESVSTPLDALGAEPGTRPWFETAARLVAGVADGLAAAHAQRIVHRDVKPGNLLFGRDGQLRLTDFGLARMLEEPGLTASGSFLGTPAYMSPEQLSGPSDRIDHRTDVYSLGAVLYELLTLSRPFPQESREAVACAILNANPTPPRRLRPKIPRDLEAICLKAIEKDPARRYEHVAAMAADLRSFLAGEAIAARPLAPSRRLARHVHRHVVPTIAGVALLLLASMGVVTLRAHQQRSEERASHALTEARLLFHQGDFRGAVDRAGRALTLAPRLVDARILRARSLVELAEPGRARAEALTLLDSDPDDWSGHLILAMVDTVAPSAPRDLTVARAHLEAVSRKAPETADVYYLRAIATPDAAAAIVLLDRALDLDPAHGDALLERMLRQVERTDLEAALADCERLIVARPRSVLGHVSKGRIHLEQLHDVAAAEQDARRALAVDPADAEAHSLAGSVLQYRVQWDAALAEYARAMELQANNAQHAVRRAQLLLRLRRFDEAAADAHRAIEIDPWSMSARWAVFRSDLGGEKRALAVESARQLEALAGTSADPRRGSAALAAAAQMQGELGNGVAAERLAARARALDPGNHLAFRASALASRIQGNRAQADVVCEEASRLTTPPREGLALGRWLNEECQRSDLYVDVMSEVVRRVPGWPEAWYALAVAYQSSGDPERAVATYRHLLELAPRWADAWQQYAEMVGLVLQRWRESLEAYDHSLWLDPWQNGSAEPYFQRAWVRFNLGDVPGARADAEEAVRRSPTCISCVGVALIAAAAAGDCGRARELEQIARPLVDGQSNPFFYFGAAFTNTTSIPLFCPEVADIDRARRFAERAVELAPPPASREHGVLGLARYREGRWREAEALLREVLRGDAMDASALRLYRAMALSRLGRRNEARAEYQRAAAVLHARNEARRPDLVALRQEAERVVGAARDGS